jgi:catechol 2,3-dioxygenase-like lactoylglutathione lyase family enzyme
MTMTEYHVGRLIDHVQLRVADLERSKAFYVAAIGALGTAVEVGEGPGFFSADELYVLQDDGPLTGATHLAFQAQDEQTVRRFYEAALEAGGTDNGAPGERSYHPGYYAAFVLDPDGNNVEAVYHGPLARSASSVILTTADAPTS